MKNQFKLSRSYFNDDTAQMKTFVDLAIAESNQVQTFMTAKSWTILQIKKFLMVLRASQK